MRISDWSSDVCSSDLLLVFGVARQTYDFHTIEQCRRNIQGIAGSHEHYIGQIEIDLDVVILEGMVRSEEHTSELQSLMRISYAVFCLKKKKTNRTKQQRNNTVTNINKR